MNNRFCTTGKSQLGGEPETGAVFQTLLNVAEEAKTQKSELEGPKDGENLNCFLPFFTGDYAVFQVRNGRQAPFSHFK
jgi:hypothetical protein